MLQTVLGLERYMIFGISKYFFIFAGEPFYHANSANKEVFLELLGNLRS